jgi:hypothetical protein
VTYKKERYDVLRAASIAADLSYFFPADIAAAAAAFRASVSEYCAVGGSS